MSTLAEQFAEAPQVWTTTLEQYMESPNWVGVHAYPYSFTPEDREAGFVLEGGKISLRVFGP